MHCKKINAIFNLFRQFYNPCRGNSQHKNLNPLSPNIDLNQISHRSITGLLVREVMRIEYVITQVKFA